MMKQPSTEMELKDILNHKDDHRAHGGRRNFDQDEQSETERQHKKQIDVTACNHFIDRKLHVEWRSEDKCLQNDRENHDLNQGVAAAAQMRPENRQWEPCTLVFGNEPFCRCQLESNPG